MKLEIPGDYGSRKFMLACWIVLSAQLMTLWGYLSAEIYQELALWSLGLYFGANVGTRIGTAKFGQ